MYTLQFTCFPGNFVKFFWIAFYQNTCKRLLLQEPVTESASPLMKETARKKNLLQILNLA